MIEQRLQANTVPIQLPLGQESSFRGVIDLIYEKALVFSDEAGEVPVEQPVPDEDKDSVRAYRQSMVEKLAENDDQLMLLYLDEKEISPSDIIAAVRRLTLNNRIVPILCGSALRNKGIQPLLDAIEKYLPSPLDVPPIGVIDTRNGEQTVREANDDAPFSALAFKVVADPFMGRLVYFRVYSGRVSKKTDSISGRIDLFICAIARSYSKSEDVRKPRKIYTAPLAAQKSTVNPS